MISDVELDLMPVNQFSIHLVSAGLAAYSLLSKRFYGNKPEVLGKFKYVMVSLSASQPNSNLHSGKHCIRYGLSCNLPYYASSASWSQLDLGSGGLPSPFPSVSFIHSDKTSFFPTSVILMLFQNCFKYQLKSVPWMALWKFFKAFVKNMFSSITFWM